MNAVFVIGGRKVPYTLIRAAHAGTRRITVTPGSVEVRVLATDGEDAVQAFLVRKKQWLFRAVRDVEELTKQRPSVPALQTGSRIPFRGRQVKLTVRRTDGDKIDLTFQRGIIVDLPLWVTRGQASSIVASELRLWLKAQLRRDVLEIASRYRARFGLRPRSIRIGDLKNAWGACGPGGSLVVNWHMIFAPKKVLEYVIAHELAHLKLRSHDPKFWRYLGTICPNYERAKGWLDTHPASLDSTFLDA